MIHKNEKGVTLVALVITVIVLLILAGTAISLAINGGDLFGKTQDAVDKWNQSYEEEEGEHGRVKATLTEGEKYVNFNQ